MMTVYALGILCSLLIGYLGRRRRMGFWGLTFGSLFLTPIMGLIILLVTDDVEPAPKT